jgi:molecular chaperone DnaK (HSP70)
MNTTYIGIDFGTSTTVVSLAYFDTSSSTILAKSIELNQKLYDGTIYNSYKIPTMVAWYNQKLLVGEGANLLKLKLKQGKNLWHSFKMELGEDVGYKYPQSELNNERIKILNPKDVTSIFFKYLKVQIEKYAKEHNLPSNIEYAVSIPASFEANQRKDLIDSLHANGMMRNKQALIDEPNAAFLSYVSDPELKHEISILEDYPTNLLVFDFGAGTCDISILEIGYNPKGFYSKNLSISRFEALGGNDIDKLIAKDILLPQFLKENKVEESFFKRKDIKQHILPRLEKTAELLKISTSKELALLLERRKLNELLDKNSSISLHHTITIKSRKGTFTLSKATLTYKEFFEINESFISQHNSKNKNIYSPIRSALKKAHLEKYDIDYLLFIGGSAKNPLIQKSLKEYFNESEHLIPKDLQAHVSQGASIHSMIFNGFNKNIIEPITSEPIIIIIKNGNDETVQTVLKAGTIIPCEPIIIDNLQVQKSNQKVIEIPICVGNKSRLLHNIEIESPDKKGFSLDMKIELKITINSDKRMNIEATVNGKKIKVKPLNPFSNADVSFRDRERFEAEKEFNKEVSSNNGEASLNALRKLKNEYERLGLDLNVAEILEEMYDKFNNGSLNNIGVAYSNAGDKEKALTFYTSAMEEEPSATTAFNIALKYKYSNKEKYKIWLKKSLEINPTYNDSLYLYGVYLIDNFEKKQGYELINKAFDSFKSEYEYGYISSNMYWFISCAKYLKKYDYAVELEEKNFKKYSDDFNSSEDYNSDNLTTVKIKQLEEV